MRRITVIVLLLVLVSTGSFCQKILDNNPPSVSWYQINKEHLDVIFPEGFEYQAQRVANTLESIYEPVSNTMEINPNRISVILQRNNTISNGFVSQAPRRSEFYGMPTQDNSFTGTLDWYDLLSVHEYRHVVQFDKSVVGFNKLLRYLFGTEVTSAMAHLAVPSWFWEGDAVNVETVLTSSGRGRIPEFDLLFRTNTLEHKTFDYHKQYLRSFKHNVPNHYITGHYLSAFLKRKYGYKTVAKITSDTWALGFQPFRFSYVQKKQTGKNLIQNYNDMMSELDSLWRQQVSDLDASEFMVLNERKSKAFINYYYPGFLSDGRIVALKSGIGDVFQFVAIDNQKKEKRLHYPGPLNYSGIISVENDKIVWNEHSYDPRWRSVVYSNIKIYDVNTGKVKRITKKGRYGSAALSPDGSKVVTVETTLESKYVLTVLNGRNGELIKAFENPENYFYVTPRWSNDGKQIITIRQSRSEKELVIIDAETGITKIIKPFSAENIGIPFLHDNWALYNSPLNGIDNIFAINLKTGEGYQVTRSRFGAYHPVVSDDGRYLIYNNFTKDGRDVAMTSFDPSDWLPIEKVTDRNVNYVGPLVSQQKDPDVLKSVSQENNRVSPYNKWRKLFNPYSWGPYVTTSLLTFDIGIRSQDILSTSTFGVGYLLNANEGTGTWYGDVSFQGLYPILNFTAFSGNRKTTESFDTVNYHLAWKEKGMNLGARIPLLLTRSNYYESLDLTINTRYTRVDGYDAPIRYLDQQGNGDLFSNQYILSYKRLMNISKRDIHSRFGQTFFFQYDHTPFGGDFFGNMLSMETRLYFPGLFKNHSLNGRVGVQFQDVTVASDRYRFSSPIAFPRGYGYTAFELFTTTSINYALPLWYMDFNLGSLLNIQRIRANLFYDGGYGEIQNSNSGFQSVGVELNFDFNVMRYLPLFDLGVRYVYRDDGEQLYQLIIGSFGL